MKMKVKVAIILLSVAFLELTEAGHRNPYRISRSHRKKKESYDYNFDYDTAEQQPSHGGEEEFHQTEYHHTDAPSSKPGYSDGSGLRSIAQGSADQANSAVANQHLAAKQASYIAQNNLANLALQASATAMAALQGKQVLLAKIEQENLDAHQQLEVELQQLRQAKRSAKAAQQAAAQAINHLQVLQAALNNAQTSSEHSQQAASEASAELASQTNMVGKAKQRVELVEDQLHQARIDYDATVKAANDAQASAQTAQNNAAEAGAKASITTLHDIHSSISAQGSSGHESGGSEHESPGLIQYSSAIQHGSEYEAASSQHRQTAASPKKTNDQVAKSSTNKVLTAKTPSPASTKSADTIASNHNYANTDFKPSKQYKFAGY